MIEIIPKLAENQRVRAGQIYYQAFRRKLQPLVGSPAQASQILTAGLNLDMVMGVVVDGELSGIAGLHTRQGIFLQVVLRDSLHNLGPVRGLFAWVVINLFTVSPNCSPDELRIAALAVDSALQGQGLGSRLLEAVFDRARREGYHAVRLEVVDTNLGARRLYERFGFGIIATHRYPIPRNWLGFSKDHVMVKKL